MRRLGSALVLIVSLAAQTTSAATQASAADFARYAETLLADAYRTDAPGVAVLVKRGDEVLFRGARGEADVAGDVPLTADDRFRIGSVTKQIAAAGLLTLVDAGKVALKDPLSKYLPTYPGGADITIEQLLNHTSGIKSYTEIPGAFGARIKVDLSTAQLVNFFKNERPDFAPGEAWRYNNSGYVLVGAVIEAASGQPWHRYLDQALFKPLGMVDTGYGADPAVIARQVTGYTVRGNAVAHAPQISMTQPHAAGALVSTVDDLTRWSRALHGGKVLTPATYALMITPVGKAKEANYGHGIWITGVRGTPALQHGGGIPGFTADLIHVPEAELTVAVLQNSETSSPAQQPASLSRRLAAVALGDPYPTLIPVAVDAALLSEYEGVYRIDMATTRTLRVVAGQLTAQRTDRPREALIPIADDTFLYSDGFNRLQVLRDDTGAVTAMRLWPDGEGEGADAALTDQALPIDFTRPGAELKRVVVAHPAMAALVAALFVALIAMKIRRRHKGGSSRSDLPRRRLG